MNGTAAVRKAPALAHSSGSGHTLMTSRQPYVSEPIASKHVCFYKSGDAQFSGLPLVINNRTFKTFEALLDSLSKRVPLPFGVRTITTPRGHTAVRSLDQLHHGHSYICSDKRTVKPVDLERARRKPPPWYNARPVSSRRRQSSVPRAARHARKSEHATFLHTPKRLVVFRNGDPEVKHTLLLQKRTTHSFESLLGLVSEVMNFPVLKLHMPDGRRVDGLPALILCSGVLVAAGREPFRKRNYDVQKPSAPTWLPAKRVGRPHSMYRKKKSLTSTSKSRPFSPSSERYIVNQIQSSFAESNHTGSEEIETGQMLESVAETDTLTCLDGEGQVETHLPTDDDIEKSFRVNQDGSMTVEMKVRLTIKEEETIHWTTTLSRSTVANQMKDLYATYSDVPMSENLPPEGDSVDTQTFTKEDDEAFQKDSGKAYEDTVIVSADKNIKAKEQPCSPTPECHKVLQKQSSVGGTVEITETEIQENLTGLHTYREETRTAEMKQEYQVVRQCSSRPVPKPRSTLPSELTTTSQLQSSTYKSAQILQVQERGEEVHETVLHIYEQQTCQGNFFANSQLCVQGTGAFSSIAGRPVSSDTVFPASSEKTVRSSSEDLESEHRPSTTQDTQKGRVKAHQTLHHHMLLAKNLSRETRIKQSRVSTSATAHPKPSASRMISTGDVNKRRRLVRIIVKKNHIFQTVAPKQRQRDHKPEVLTEIKKIRADIVSRSRGMKLNEHYRAKAVQKLLKRRNNATNGQRNADSMSHHTVQLKIQSPNEASLEKENLSKERRHDKADLQTCRNLNDNVTTQKKDLLYASISKSTLTRQTSMHEEQHFQRETQELRESISLPALHSSSSVFNEYMEHWLQKSEPEPPSGQDGVILTVKDIFLQDSQPTCEAGHGIEASKEDLQCCDMKKYINIALPIGSLQEKSTTAEKDPLPRTFSQKNNTRVESFSSDDNLLQHENSDERKNILNDSQEKTPLPRNISLKKTMLTSIVTSDSSTAPMQSSLDFQKLASREEIMPHPRSLKKSGIEQAAESLDNVSTGNDHVKQTPASENTLISQASIEKIPKNNTLSKASLFTKPSVENTPLHDKTTTPRHSSLIKESESSCTLLSKSQLTNEPLKTNRNHHNDIPPYKRDTNQEPSNAEMTAKARKLYTVKMAVRPDMRPVLEELCHSIQSLREVTQHKPRSCLEKSNSLPDFSSHLASTFGSSSRVLLAFLSVMTLKEGLANLNTHQQAGGNLSCSEALIMLQSLKEMAAIENAEHLRSSLNALQKSTSAHLLQSWRAFQELSNRSRSCSVTPDSTRKGSCGESGLEEEVEEEEAIQGLMEDLGVPERVREELATLCNQEEESIRGNQVKGLQQWSESVPEVNVNGFKESHQIEDIMNLPDSLLEDVNIYVKSVIEKAINVHLEASGSSEVSMEHLLASAEKAIEVEVHKQKWDFCHMQRTEQADSVLESDFCEDVSSHESVMEEKQQTVGESTVELKTREHQVNEEVECNGECKIKSESKEKEDEVPISRDNEVTSGVEGRIEFVESNAHEQPTLVEKHKHHKALHSSEEKEMTDIKGKKERRIDSKNSKPSKSPNNSDQLTTSEEDKSSLEEDDSCDEELMSFSEDQASDKEEIFIEPSSVHQIHSMQEHGAKWQSEEQASQTQGQQHNLTDCEVKSSEIPPASLSIHVETHMKESKIQSETEQQKLSYEDQIIASEGEQVVLESPECYTVYQEAFDEQKECSTEEATEVEENTLHFTEQPEKSVAEFIRNLESVAQKACIIAERPVNRYLTPTEVAAVSNPGDFNKISNISSELECIEAFVRSQSGAHVKSKRDEDIHAVSPDEPIKICRTTEESHVDLTSETLPSSLAFSYDSRSSSLAREPDGGIQVNRVKSIREMFLAKSNTRSQNGQRRLPSPNSDLSDCQTESSDSSGQRPQTSPDASSGEDDTSKLAIAKGFVRRTIERLYGRTNSNSTGPDDKRPQSASKGKRREGPGRTNVTTLASFHEARTRAVTDLTYFNATSSFDAANEATHCVTLNAQVRPGEAVLIDRGRWLLRENQPIPESSLELQESPRIGKKITTALTEKDQHAVKEAVPYSLFCPASPYKDLTVSEHEELTGTSEPKVAYFNLPNESDSELQSEEQKKDDTTPKTREVKVTPIIQFPKSWVERNSILPAFSPPVVKKPDNKVHPLIEAVTPPVVTQPIRGQTAQTGIARRSAEPDALEMLFMFCGQHCPIL